MIFLHLYVLLTSSALINSKKWVVSEGDSNLLTCNIIPFDVSRVPSLATDVIVSAVIRTVDELGLGFSLFCSSDYILFYSPVHNLFFPIPFNFFQEKFPNCITYKHFLYFFYVLLEKNGVLKQKIKMILYIFKPFIFVFLNKISIDSYI